MRTRYFVHAVCVVGAAGALIVACETRSSRRPFVPTAPSPGPSGPTLVRLELTGPGTVAIGETAQFTATAHLSDGTTRDVSGESAWQINGPPILTASAGGRFTGFGPGETTVTVSYQGLRSTLGGVIVVPPGTYRLKGTVRDAGLPIDARVTIDDDVKGRTELTTFNGAYTVYGVAGETEVTVARSGYVTQTRQQVMTSHQVMDFDLQLDGSRPDVSGRYTLEVTAAASCTALPGDLRTRSYGALVEQNGPAVMVTLSGPQFVVDNGRTRNRFTGFVESDRIVFRLASSLDDFYYYYFVMPDVLEILSSNRYYAFEGVAVTPARGGLLDGTLQGAVGQFTGPPYWPTSRCVAQAHRFVLARAQ